MKQFSKDLGNVCLAPKGKWSKEQEYERLALVYNASDNLSYVAKINVPIGVEIDNREYWQPMNATGYSDNNFINLTAENENGTITAYENIEEAIATIVPVNRRVGATLSFYNLNSDRLDRQAEFELWQFNSTDLANWENKDYWNNIYYNWNVFVGWYIGDDTLKNHVKIPNVGQYAYVGSNLNDAILYQCRTNGTWTNTGIKVRNYISVVVSGNITIGENGNWFSNGEDTGIPATPAVDEQLDNIIMQLQQHTIEINNLKASDANLQDQITSNDSDITNLNSKHESLSRTVQGIAATGGASTATNVTYNNDTSGLNAENAQDAIDELQGSKVDKTSILQELGNAKDKVMSQKAVSDKLSDLGSEIHYKVFAATIKSTGTGIDRAVPSGLIKNGVSFTVEAVDFGDNSEIDAYIIYKDGSNKQLFSLKKEESLKTAVISLDSSKEFNYIRIHAKQGNYTVKVGVDNLDFRIKQNANNIQQNADDIKQNAEILNYKVFAATIKSTDTNINEAVPSGLIKNGVSFTVEAVDFGDNSEIDAYIIYKDGSNKQLFSLKKEESLKTAVISLDSSKEFNYIRIHAKQGNYTVKVGVDNLDFRIKQNAEYLRPSLNVLILGDSYSQGGGSWIKPMISKFGKNSKWISLGVSSATLRDKYQDLNLYPYSSRPIQTDSTGNRNTIACQIEKLKRLIAGTDLDENETQLYTREDEYPDVIIIEGGMNDTVDSDSVEQLYARQFEKHVNNVYAKVPYQDEVKLYEEYYIKTPISEVNRTCFAGAYRYLVEQLLSIFPNAQIFITTVSGLGYHSSSVLEKRYKQAKQQRMCADLCGVSIIDWHNDGQISIINNYPYGNGTQENPYTDIVPEQLSNIADSNDAMHPNKRGGEKYGYIAAKTILSKLIEIS